MLLYNMYTGININDKMRRRNECEAAVEIGLPEETREQEYQFKTRIFKGESHPIHLAISQVKKATIWNKFCVCEHKS
ncbi:MAG: hypothetical protein H6Q66_2315 [Firmicutes bacterium]|nr:hypothetical protein [Bacillota bacterium]